MGLERLRHLLVELEIFLLGALPHPGSLGLVPDLPVFDAMLEAVGPALVVVADDVDADAREFVHVGRRPVVVGGVWLDALAEPVDDLRAAGDEALQVGVGLGKRVVPRVVGIEVEEWEDRGDVDDVGRGAVAVVQPGRRKTGLAEPGPQIGVFPVGHRSVADAMDRADLAHGLRKVDGDRLVGRGRCRNAHTRRRQARQESQGKTSARHAVDPAVHQGVIAGNTSIGIVYGSSLSSRSSPSVAPSPPSSRPSISSAPSSSAE